MLHPPKCLLLFVLLCTIYFHNHVESAGSSDAAISVSHVSGDNAVLAFLQSEATSVSLLQHNVRLFLHEKRIPVGLQPKSLRKLSTARSSFNDALKQRVALSTDDNYIPCRISLDKAPVGSKCVAPCGCTGSSKWIQFSELNRLRRKEPSQWRFCQICQQKFDYNGLVLYGGVSGNIVSAVLDNTKMLRMGLFTGMAIFGYVFSFGNLILRFLLSRLFWQAYPRWSRIVHLPLLLKFWGGKIIFQYIFDQYLVIEDIIVDYLIKVETDMIEPNLPITVGLEETENKVDLNV